MQNCVMFMPELGELLLEDDTCVKVPEHVLTFSDVEGDVSRIEYWAKQQGHIKTDVQVAFLC